MKSLLCWFQPCPWVYLGAFEQADPSEIPGTQGQRGLYQCPRCKTVSTGSPTDPDKRIPTFIVQGKFSSSLK